MTTPDAQGEGASRWRDGSAAQLARRLWFGEGQPRPTYVIARVVFLRMVGVVYLIAFLSLWTQIAGLVGDHGILPVGKFLHAAEDYFAAQEPSESGYWNLPTLLWISPHDGMLQLLCATGTAASILLILGLVPMASLVALWLCYLSLFHGGQVFLGFQWDILLLETGFIAIFVAPFTWRSTGFLGPQPPRLAMWLVWWLLFRLMLESGAVKLTWNRWDRAPNGLPVANAWESLTALTYHYWTQPLPIWTSWYAAKLPLWLQEMSVVGVFTVELVLPWFIFGPRVFRYIAFGGITAFMLLIGATGNYNYFNLLTVVLASTLLDDRAWPDFLRRRIPLADPPATARGKRPVRSYLLVPFAAVSIVLGTCQIKEAIAPAENPAPSLESDLRLAPFVLVNSYGLFRQMTETRPEIVIEGSTDGHTWMPYPFRWKPGDLARRPGFNTPHQPRLDWQMWFEALRFESVYSATGSVDLRYMSPWFRSFIARLLTGGAQVLDLLGGNPFPDGPPKFVRVVLYHYRFTDFAQRRATGDWWQRELVWVGAAWSLGSP